MERGGRRSRQELKQRAWWDPAYWLASPGLLSLLSYKAGPTCLGMVPPTVRALEHQPSTPQTGSQDSLEEATPWLRFLLSSRVKLTTGALTGGGGQSTVGAVWGRCVDWMRSRGKHTWGLRSLGNLGQREGHLLSQGRGSAAGSEDRRGQ